MFLTQQIKFHKIVKIEKFNHVTVIHIQLGRLCDFNYSSVYVGYCIALFFIGCLFCLTNIYILRISFL